MLMKEFSKVDWYGYAGCEEAEGQPPYIGECSDDENEITVVQERNGSFC